MPTYVLVWLTALINPILYVACNATYRAVARYVDHYRDDDIDHNMTTILYYDENYDTR